MLSVILTSRPLLDPTSMHSNAHHSAFPESPVFLHICISPLYRSQNVSSSPSSPSLFKRTVENDPHTNDFHMSSPPPCPALPPTLILPPTPLHLHLCAPPPSPLCSPNFTSFSLLIFPHSPSLPFSLDHRPTKPTC